MLKVKLSVYICIHILQHYKTEMEKKIEEPHNKVISQFLPKLSHVNIKCPPIG